MKLMRLAYMAAYGTIASVALAGSAMASDVSLGTTGPDSNQTVKIDNSSNVDIDTKNWVDVSNVNVQKATTGDVNAEKNTSVGGLSSGNASNVNNAATAVKIANNAQEKVVGVGIGAGPGFGQGVGVGAAQGASAAAPPGNVLGASVGPGMGAGAAMLPGVGAQFPMDVSALRAAWQPQSAAPTAVATDRTAGLRTALLGLAVLMTLVGMAGSFAYGRGVTKGAR